MTETRDVAVRLAVLKALRDEVVAQYERVRKEAAEVLDVGDRKSAVLPDGRDIGTVSKTRSRPTAKVSDPKALLAWVEAEHPTEVETVTRVRESFMGEVLGRAENADGEAVWPKTGELIPGVEFGAGEAYARCVVSAEQRETFVRAWVDGHIRIPGLIGAQRDIVTLESAE